MNLGLIAPHSALMKFSILYYDIVCYVLALSIFIVFFVFFLLFWKSTSGGTVNFGGDKQVVELTWTFLPTIIVLVLCALKVKFITRGLDSFSSLTVKIVGRQWYWRYDYLEGSYDSFVCKGGFTVDKPLKLICHTPYRFLVTSSDVIHSFSVPDLRLKMDAIPGRVNQCKFTPDRVGIFVGYCSEFCGVNHGIMPILIEVVM